MKRVQPHSLRRWFAGVILLLAAFAPHLFASGHFPAAGDTLHASFPNAHLFTGEEFDADLGLYHLRARYHNPDTGRFWTQDGFEGFGGDPASLHKYAYCGNNPVNARDPGGEMSIGEVVNAAAIGAASTAWVNMVASGVAAYQNNLAFGDVYGVGDFASDVAFGGVGGIAGYGVGKAGFWAVGKAAPYLAECGPVRALVAYARESTKLNNAYGMAAQAWKALDDAVIQGSEAATRSASAALAEARAAIAELIGTVDSLGARLGFRSLAAKTGANVTQPVVKGFVNIGGGATTAENALGQAQKWLGQGYKEIAPGVYRSADNTRQFRMTVSDLTDLKQGPHVHFEAIGADGRTIIENSHLGITNP